MEEDYGKELLNVCDNCEHYYKIDSGDLCPCKSDEEINQEVEK